MTVSPVFSSYPLVGSETVKKQPRRVAPLVPVACHMRKYRLYLPAGLIATSNHKGTPDRNTDQWDSSQESRGSKDSAGSQYKESVWIPVGSPLPQKNP